MRKVPSWTPNVAQERERWDVYCIIFVIRKMPEDDVNMISVEVSSAKRGNWPRTRVKWEMMQSVTWIRTLVRTVPPPWG